MLNRLSECDKLIWNSHSKKQKCRSKKLADQDEFDSLSSTRVIIVDSNCLLRYNDFFS